MQLLRTSFFSLVLVTLVFLLGGDGAFMCLPCEDDDCEIMPDNCLHGIVRDFCGRYVCAKGPGERCGGPSQILGRCGRGMQCFCEHCNGCSTTTLECVFNNDICFK